MEREEGASRHQVIVMKHPSNVKTADAFEKRKPNLRLTFILHKVEKSLLYLLGEENLYKPKYTA